MKFRLPHLRQRSEISEILIHALFTGFVFLILDVNSPQKFQIFLVVGTLFFAHALILIPYLFKREFTSYLTITASLSLLVLIFGILTGAEGDELMQEVVPTILFTLITSGGYGVIRWQIVGRLNNYAFTANTKTAELQLLKSQINPHFIFNSLNILYATALEEQSAKTAESIAKMSNLIRYMLEDNTKEFVSVHKEVKYLQDYIKLQLMRSSVQHDIDIHLDIAQDQSIAPMLLIPFVENAFKHGINPKEPSTLFLQFTCNEQWIHFQLINSVDDSRYASDFEKGFGIGIENVEKRLQLIYPKRHKLSVGREHNVFSVELEIRNK